MDATSKLPLDQRKINLEIEIGAGKITMTELDGIIGVISSGQKRKT